MTDHAETDEAQPDLARPCKRCGAIIPAERMEAVPGGTLCVKCSDAVGGEWVYHFSEVNTAKVGSLKKNYGSISLQKRRKEIE